MTATLEVSSTIGPIVTGVVLNAFIFGICVMQFSTYYTAGFKDRLSVRTIVYWSILLDAFHTISSTYLLWIYVVDNFTNPAVLSTAPWPYASTPIFIALTSVPIQHFLAWRIKQQSSSNPIFVCLSLLSLSQGTLGIIIGSRALADPMIARFYKLVPIVDVWNGISIVCDLSTTFFLAKYWKRGHIQDRRASQLNRHTASYYATQKDTVSAMDNMFIRLMLQFIETAAFPLFFCIMDFVTFTVLQDTNYHLIFGIPLGRIYTNTLLTTLNGRADPNQDLGSTINDTPVPLSTLSGDDGHRSMLHDVESFKFSRIEGLSHPENALVLPIDRDAMLSRPRTMAPE